VGRRFDGSRESLINCHFERSEKSMVLAVRDFSLRSK